MLIFIDWKDRLIVQLIIMRWKSFEVTDLFNKRKIYDIYNSFGITEEKIEFIEKKEYF